MKLIDKDALVAKIEKEIKRIYAGREYVGISFDEENIVRGIQKVEDIIDTLEVKDVDLEKEADEMWNYVFSELGWDENTRMTITHKEFMALTKHFFELGLKAKG